MSGAQNAGVSVPSSAPSVSVSAKDLALACARDPLLFARYWFPRTTRQGFALKHKEMMDALDDNKQRYVNIIASRGFAKTSLAGRVYSARRIAYATSHTMLYIGPSDPHAKRSISWIRGQIAKEDPSSRKLVPTKFGAFYGLRPGSKWNENEIEVIHEGSQRPIWLLGLGITGEGIRGINFDDFRPDFIFLDDVLTDENTATKEQRAKLFDLIYGAVFESLAPKIDEPNAKLVLANTLHDPDDVAVRAQQDKRFHTVVLPCWTEETSDSPVESQESAWPARLPSEDLREEKKAAIEANRYSVFAREKECKLVTRETAAFQQEWTRIYTVRPQPMYCVLAIDPVPPASERQIAKSLKDKDFEVHLVLGRYAGEYHVLDVRSNQGHEPNWSVSTALSLAREFRVAKIGVEAVAYQRVLKYLIEIEMKRRGIYYIVDPVVDKRNKFTRITSTISGPLAAGKIHVRSDMHDLLREISMYPTVQHDDHLDALAIALMMLQNPYLEKESADNVWDEWDKDTDEGAFAPQRACP